MNEVPPGFVKKDDGCICPAEEEEGGERKKRRQEPCPYDPRFPNTNQTKHCYFSFIDFQRCARLLGDYPGCKIFYRCYMELCPSAWYERWYDQMDAGTFPRKIYPPKPVIRPDPKKMEAMDEADLNVEDPTGEELPIC